MNFKRNYNRPLALEEGFKALRAVCGLKGRYTADRPRPLLGAFKKWPLIKFYKRIF